MNFICNTEERKYKTDKGIYVKISKLIELRNQVRHHSFSSLVLL